MYFIGKNFVAMFTQWENIRNIFFFLIQVIRDQLVLYQLFFFSIKSIKHFTTLSPLDSLNS